MYSETPDIIPFASPLILVSLMDPREVALEEFKRLDEAHHPRSLPREVLAELDRILAAAEREAERIG